MLIGGVKKIEPFKCQSLSVSQAFINQIIRIFCFDERSLHPAENLLFLGFRKPVHSQILAATFFRIASLRMGNMTMHTAYNTRSRNCSLTMHNFDLWRTKVRDGGIVSPALKCGANVRINRTLVLLRTRSVSSHLRQNCISDLLCYNIYNAKRI